MSRLNSLRTLATAQTEDEPEEPEVSDDLANVSQDGSMMEFEQDLLSLTDVMSPPPVPPTAEIRVNSEDLVNRVADEVVDRIKLEMRKQNQATEALLSRMEYKLDQLLEQEPPTRKPPSLQTSKDTRVCYYCREEGHLANKCKLRVNCHGCGGDQHPYDRCSEQTSTCKKCDVVGHNALVHETLDPVLRKKLYDSNPDVFSHFFAVDNRVGNAQKRLHRGATKRRSSWEEQSRKSEKGSSNSRTREVRDKHPRVERTGKGKPSRRTV